MLFIFLICISQNTVSYVDDNKLFIANGIGELENETIIKISATEDLITLEEINIL